eukprot:TRINITY_DN154_c0_g1_i2.p2 TRINITY_DN154_c0_g1~~TRINITY_DN154_c0_g1_i2.p2  ORF type:complete len:103 (+),score=36.88 TRINITY_DN154_c0_g1_i2:70-378(+)
MSAERRYEEQRNRTDAKLKEAQQKTQVLMKQTRDNIDAVIAREPKLNELDDKTKQLEDESRRFKKGATDVRRHFCLQYWKVTALIVVVLIVLILIIYFSVKK